MFYLGKIRTIQLEYTDAKESLLQAARKAPVAALGFRVQCNKWAVIVRLLLGEIPERTVFMQKGMEKALRPYFELTNVSVTLPVYYELLPLFMRDMIMFFQYFKIVECVSAKFV